MTDRTPANLYMARQIAQAVFGASDLLPESHPYVRQLMEQQKETLIRQHRAAKLVLMGRETRQNLRREFGDHEPGDDA